MLTPQVAGERHYRVALAVRRTLTEYAELKDIIAMLGLEEPYESDQRLVGGARRIERLLTQPFFTTEHLTGEPGRRVRLGDTFSSRVPRPASDDGHVLRMEPLLPLDVGPLFPSRAMRWSGRSLPTFEMDTRRLRSALLRQYLFMATLRAFAESSAAEDSGRLRAMASAERSIGEHRRGGFAAEPARGHHF